MKIPKSVRIGGVEYKVEFIENLNNGIEMCHGHIDFVRCVIQLNASEEYNNQKLCQVLWHEIMHGIQQHIGVDLGEDEEEIVDMFARGTYEVLQDNAKRFFDIKY